MEEVRYERRQKLTPDRLPMWIREQRADIYKKTPDKRTTPINYAGKHILDRLTEIRQKHN
jgi:hypothetical protein